MKGNSPLNVNPSEGAVEKAGVKKVRHPSIRTPSGWDTRLKSSKEFNRLFGKGERVKSGSVVLVYRMARDLKVGFSVSKKHGKSVMRNRIKRLMRAAFTSLKGAVEPNYHLVFLPRVREEYSYAVFLKDMEKAMRAEGIIKC